jgi:hypothetical protein
MANQLSLAYIANVPAGYQSGTPAGTNLIDRNAVRIYEREKLIRYSVILSGTYATHVRGQNVGEVLNLGQVYAPVSYQADQLWGYKGPTRGYLVNIGNVGYSMSVVPGADPLHWLLCIFSNVATELAAGAYPAALTTDQDIVLEFSGLVFD